MLGVVRDEHGGTAVGDRLGYDRIDEDPRRAIQSGGRFVEQNQTGPGEQQPGEIQTPPHPVRRPARLSTTGGCQPYPVQRLVGRDLILSAEPGYRHQILTEGQVCPEGWLVACQTDCRADPAHVVAPESGTENSSRPAPGTQERGENPEQGGLPGTVGTDDPEHLSRGHHQVDVLEH